MQCFRDKVHPQIIPYYEEITVEPALKVAVITIAQGASKPYVLRHKEQERICIRSGTTSRDASREEQARLHSLGGLLHPESLPVSGTNIDSLDLVRIENYLSDVLQDTDIASTDDQWKERLSGLGFINNATSETMPCTIAGLLSFGISPAGFYLKLVCA